MVKRYLLATQRPWGVDVFARVARARPDHWTCLYVPPFEVGAAGGALEALLLDIRPRYAFFVNWSELVATPEIERFECVNFHCTDLPYGRGGHPIENLLLSGVTETMMTAHRMVRELDAGPIYFKLPISLEGITKDAILDGFVEPCARLIGKIIDTEPQPEPQQGRVVRFSRLSYDAYQRFWKLRETVR